ncbi:MAG: ThuA domain-containing protein [Pedobacter sp.]|nr:MAG: ThuA domain-containing protein [Pedobacter sp.]
MKIKINFYLFLLLFLFSTSEAIAQEKKQFNVLLITKTAGWHHESINEGVAAIKKMAEQNYFNVQWHQEGITITAAYLQKFQAVIFLNTTGDIFTPKEQGAIEQFIKSGNGFVGVHSASDTEYEWPWYTRLVGRMFHIHPIIQTAKLRLTNQNFTGLSDFKDGQLWTDEWYEFGPELTKDLNYILAVDETSYNPKVEWTEKKLKGEGMGNFHPIAWYHNYDGGRSFYTALGHMPSDYSNNSFLNHLYAGIYWAATGKK